MRVAGSSLLVAVVLVLAPGEALAKEFGPGDLRVCGRIQCVSVEARPLLRALSSFVYIGQEPARVAAPAADAPSFQLRFRDGFVAGVVAGRSLDRARIHGLVCGRFVRGRWYRLPPAALVALRTLTEPLAPRRRIPAAPRSC